MDDKIKSELSKPLDRQFIRERSQAGRSLSYLEGHHVIREANRIFGFDGWVQRIVSLSTCDCGKNERDNFVVSAEAIVTIEAIGTSRTDVGYGSGVSKSMADAYESAGKEAVTDAMKRALRTFGDQFGNALYDKEQKHVAATPAPQDDIHTRRKHVQEKVSLAFGGDIESIKSWLTEIGVGSVKLASDEELDKIEKLLRDE